MTKTESPLETEVVAETTDELVFDDDPDKRELDEDESAEVEKTYYKVILP